jgi:hypothetical protein
MTTTFILNTFLYSKYLTKYKQKLYLTLGSKNSFATIHLYLQQNGTDTVFFFLTVAEKIFRYPLKC